MTKTMTAIYDGQCLRPEAPLDLKPNTRCRITVETPSDATPGDAWDALASATGSVQAPSDWAEQHDHYLYGTPKRQDPGK